MKKIITITITIIILLLAVGCKDDEYVSIDSGSYLTSSQYTTLIDTLRPMNNMTKATIDAELNNLGVTGADYTYFSSSYECHSYVWSSFNDDTFDWNYYVTVDIWVNSGVLNEGMCSYYSE